MLLQLFTTTNNNFPFQFLCMQVSLIFASYHASCSKWACLYPHLFVCLFVCSLCSTAKLTRHHFAQTVGMIQLKGVISQNALMMVVVLELTGLHKERYRKRERWHAVRWCLQHTSVVAQWLHCRQGKISLPLLLSGGRKDQPAVRAAWKLLLPSKAIILAFVLLLSIFLSIYDLWWYHQLPTNTKQSKARGHRTHNHQSI